MADSLRTAFLTEVCRDVRSRVCRQSRTDVAPSPQTSSLYGDTVFESLSRLSFRIILSSNKRLYSVLFRSANSKAERRITNGTRSDGPKTPTRAVSETGIKTVQAPLLPLACPVEPLDVPPDPTHPPVPQKKTRPLQNGKDG